MPREPNTAQKAQKKPYNYNICRCTEDIKQPRFEDFITSLYVFMNVVYVFVRKELWVNVPVAIFFSYGGLAWPNTVFARAFADAIQRAHKDYKNKHAVNKSFYLPNTRTICVIFL